MDEITIIPIPERLCDFCNDQLTNENNQVLRDFVLTDYGAICHQCWHGVEHKEEFQIFREYRESETIIDEWIHQPMVMQFGDDLWP